MIYVAVSNEFLIFGVFYNIPFYSHLSLNLLYSISVCRSFKRAHFCCYQHPFIFFWQSSFLRVTDQTTLNDGIIQLYVELTTFVVWLFYKIPLRQHTDLLELFWQVYVSGRYLFYWMLYPKAHGFHTLRIPDISTAPGFGRHILFSDISFPVYSLSVPILLISKPCSRDILRLLV